MKMISINKENCNKLERYWKKISKGIPYFYPVNMDELAYSLLDDRKCGERMFCYLESYLIEENGKELGFIQFGQPHIYWDTEGQKFYNPNIGIIRDIYFNEDRVDVGRTLINKAEMFFNKNSFDNCFAFNHALGLSCNAYHGKLHESKKYIADLLREYGYNVEHENIYYTMNLNTLQEVGTNEDIKIIKNEIDEYNKEVINLIYKNKKIGESVILYLSNIKGVYMDTIWVDESYSNKGFGSQFIKLICNDLWSNGYKRLDLDTVKNNLDAQRFYERNGFINKGITRSYYRLKKYIQLMNY